MPATEPSILLTRPVARSQEFAKALRDRIGDDLNIVISPVMRIESCAGIAPFPADHLAIFTSASAVTAMRDHMPVPGTPAFCVGKATTSAAQSAGWDAIFAGEDANALVDQLIGNPPGKPLIHLRGEHTRGQVAARLASNSMQCSERIIYRQIEESLTELAQKTLKSDLPVIIPLFSPRSATLLLAKLPQQSGKLWLVTMSAAVTQAWGNGPRDRLVEAATPDQPAMLAAAASLISQLRKLEGKDGAG